MIHTKGNDPMPPQKNSGKTELFKQMTISKAPV